MLCLNSEVHDCRAFQTTSGSGYSMDLISSLSKGGFPFDDAPCPPTSVSRGFSSENIKPGLKEESKSSCKTSKPNFKEEQKPGNKISSKSTHKEEHHKEESRSSKIGHKEEHLKEVPKSSSKSSKSSSEEHGKDEFKSSSKLSKWHYKEGESKISSKFSKSISKEENVISKKSRSSWRSKLHMKDEGVNESKPKQSSKESLYNSISKHIFKEESLDTRKLSNASKKEPRSSRNSDAKRSGSTDESSASEKELSFSPYRIQLENDIRSLQQKLNGEMQLHIAFECAIGKSAASLSNLSALPEEARELLSNIAVLESTVMKLEEELVSLHFQISQEKNERRLAEYRMKHSPSPQFLASAFEVKTVDADSDLYPVSVLALENEASDTKTTVYSSPEEKNEDDNLRKKIEDNKYMTPKLRHSKTRKLMKELSAKGLWNHPNYLSEEMVRCMKNIYICLGDSSVISSGTSIDGAQQPASPHGPLSASSLSSFSEPSEHSTPFLSRSTFDLHLSGEILSDENIFDPYKFRGKLSWADIGSYGLAVEVSWMSAGKKQLDYASGALRRFRSLVEQLAKVNPTNLTSDEKLAFWINTYNALILHAYLAYGVPKSELKHFSLMQKAAYTIGGHPFNAATIEYAILKMKPPVYRPQTALLLALHKLKLSEEQQYFAVDASEPLVTFALSCGMYSSPAVRIYTASSVREELEQNLKDFVRASVGLNAKGKLFIPKMLQTYGRTLVDEPALAGWVCQFLSSKQAAMVDDCLSERRLLSLGTRGCAIVPFDSRFRYLFLPENII